MEQLLESGPELLLDWHDREESPRRVQAFIGTIVVHILIFAFFTLLARLDNPRRSDPEEVFVPKKYTPLIAPRFQLTQKEPTQGKIAKQVRVEDLLPKPQIQQRTPTPAAVAKKAFQAPPQNPLPPAPTPAALPPPEPPKYEASAKPPQALSPSVNAVPPPQIQPEEKPKLAFETPGQGGTSTVQGGTPLKIPIPKPTLEDAVRSVARSGGGGSGVTVGDIDQLPSLPDSLRRKPTPGRMQSQVQLLSDPMGVDFKPYLIRVLATVKRNWFAVYPESARLGLRGTVALKFWVDRVGQVPHLEIAMPSGATALDRAAVASISASVPLPALPSEFKGKQIVLQFSFQYN